MSVLDIGCTAGWQIVCIDDLSPARHHIHICQLTNCRCHPHIRYTGIITKSSPSTHITPTVHKTHWWIVRVICTSTMDLTFPRSSFVYRRLPMLADVRYRLRVDRDDWNVNSWFVGGRCLGEWRISCGVMECSGISYGDSG